MADLRIAHISKRGCIRVAKESVALKAKGCQVQLMCECVPPGYNLWDSVIVYGTREQLATSVRESPADIFHVHNEPDWMIKVAKEAAGKRPVVFDCHDLDSLRLGNPPDQDEINAFASADGLVHVSHGQQAAAEAAHGNGKPTLLLYSLVNECWRPIRVIEPCWRGVVYEGGLLSAPAESTFDANGNEIISYRSWEPVVKAFTSQGYMVHLYSVSSSNGLETSYSAVGGIVQGTLIYPLLMSAMRLYGFGLVGSPYLAPIMQAAMPNKLFEYMACGVVPVICNASEAGRYVQERGLGIILHSLQDLDKQLAEGPVCRERILAIRESLTMENEIHRLIEFYRSLL